MSPQCNPIYSTESLKKELLSMVDDEFPEIQNILEQLEVSNKTASGSIVYLKDKLSDLSDRLEKVESRIGRESR